MAPIDVGADPDREGKGLAEQERLALAACELRAKRELTGHGAIDGRDDAERPVQLGEALETLAGDRDDRGDAT